MAIDLPKRIADHIDGFTGRTWLLPKIQDWWDNRKDERLFLLTGGPGTGKSMILAWLAGFGPEPPEDSARAQLSRIRKAVKGVHFCQADSRNITPQAFAQNIANQLTVSINGFGAALASTLAERVSIVGKVEAGEATNSTLTGVSIGGIDLGTLGDEQSFDRAFTQPVQKLYEGGYSEPILLLVDALDEAHYYTGTTIPSLLSRLSDLPPQVRLLATTRDEPRVLTFFHGIKPFDLIKDADPDAHDVFTYAKGRLAKLDTVDMSTRQSFAQRLSTQSNGIFLYAALVLDELCPRLPSQFPNLDTYPLPNGLSGIYHGFLVRELGTEDRGRRWHRVYKPLLGLIAVSQGDGLTAGQLTTLIGEEVAEALDACKQYLSGELPYGPFKPFHKSFADFLFEDKQNVRYHIDAQSMHQRIAEHYWSNHCTDWTDADRYALTHISTHLGMVQAWQQLEQLLLDISFVRAVSHLSHEVLTDAYGLANRCLERMSDGPRRKLLSQLSAIAKQLRSFTDRPAATEVIESFLNSDDRQHLLIVGLPGIGKSTLASVVWIRHFDCCSLAKLRPNESLRKTLLMMVHNSPFLREYLPQEQYDHLERLSSSTAYRILFCLAARCNREVCFIIDELDVARDVEWEIAEFPLDLPPNLRFIWVSRNIPALNGLTQAARVLNLDEMSATEMLDFCRRRIEGKVHPEFLQRLVALSHGSPLYIDLIVKELERGVSIEELLEGILGQSLARLYEGRMRQLETNYPEMKERVVSLVRAITSKAQTRSVRLNDVGIKFNDVELDAITASGLFVVQAESKGTIIGVIHASALDFLRQRYEPG